MDGMSMDLLSGCFMIDQPNHSCDLPLGILFATMRHVDPYNIAFVFLAAVIVYPEIVAQGLYELTGRAFGWRCLVLSEVLAIGALVGATLLFMHSYPELRWWYPLLIVGLGVALRLGTSLATRLFGFDDDP